MQKTPQDRFDVNVRDAMAMPVERTAPEQFPLEDFERHAEACDKCYEEFLAKKSGVAVWQRVRAGEVFRDACADKKISLEWQLGALARSLAYKSDAPMYLEPWYGIGTTAAAFGASYVWLPGQSPGVHPPHSTLQDAFPLRRKTENDIPILSETLATIEYFLEKTKGRLPISWCDLQAPLNVVGGIVDITHLLEVAYDEPEKLKELLAAAADEIQRFTQIQSRLIGAALAKPGHGFASSRRGQGIGLSTDNLIMVSPSLFGELCHEDFGKLAASFGGVAFHSCGNWGRWIPTVKAIPGLCLVDGAFSPQTDPAYNVCEEFRDAFSDSGVIVHARLVGNSEQVMSHVRRLWKPGMRLIVVTHVQNPQEQQQLYEEIHAFCR